MYYYKIINGSTFIGAVTSLNLRKYQTKHNVILSCDEEDAQYIQIGEEIYHAMWMRPETIKGLYPTVDVIEITETEYRQLKELIDNGEDIQIDISENIEEAEVDTPSLDQSELITLDFAKTKKIETLSKCCEQTILNGFDLVLSDGVSHHFSLETTDQIMISALALKAQSGETALPWHADNEECKFYKTEDILLLNSKMESLIIYQQSYFNSLKKYVQSFNTITEVMEIEYGIAIPTEYQNEVLQTLLAQMEENAE